jgi:hypothetical protein
MRGRQTAVARERFWALADGEGHVVAFAHGVECDLPSGSWSRPNQSRIEAAGPWDRFPGVSSVSE